jgi:hypothetical protein
MLIVRGLFRIEIRTVKRGSIHPEGTRSREQ